VLIKLQGASAFAFRSWIQPKVGSKRAGAKTASAATAERGSSCNGSRLSVGRFAVVDFAISQLLTSGCSILHTSHVVNFAHLDGLVPLSLRLVQLSQFPELI